MNIVYNTAKRDFLNGVHDWDAGGQVFKVLLLGSGYTPDPDHEFVSSLTAFEITGTGYTGGFSGSGRKALASRVVVADQANNRAEADAADTTWPGVTLTGVQAAVIYREGTSDADSNLIAYFDSGFPSSPSGQDLIVQWNAEGILQVS